MPFNVVICLNILEILGILKLSNWVIIGFQELRRLNQNTFLVPYCPRMVFFADSQQIAILFPYRKAPNGRDEHFVPRSRVNSINTRWP